MSTSQPQPTAGHHLDRRGRAKLLTAGLVGSSIEWYDFFLFSTAAAIVFPHVFFPEQSQLTATLASFATFWAGFLARPIGGMLAGHMGDKHGRKPVVVASLLLMGLATFLIGCLPSAAKVGALAPTLLVTLRFLQGIAAGAQWGGIVLLLTESYSPKKRGFAGTFGQMGVPIGLLMGSLAFLIVGGSVSQASFMSWGWRVPFWFSAVLFPVVMFIHLKVEDTPEFKELAAEVSERRARHHVVQAPLREAVRTNWKRIVLGCGLLAATNVMFYISILGLMNYGVEQLGIDKNDMLLMSLIASAVSVPMILWAGQLSDRIGRRPVVIVGALILIVWAFPYFNLVNTGRMSMIYLAVMVASVGQNLTYGPLAAYLGEMFAPEVRMSGASLAYQLSAITVSGATPFIMAAIMAKTGSSFGVSVYITVIAILTLLSVLATPETNPKEIRQDPTAVPGTNLY
ncbi:MFS transporter [Actinomycetota bacterium]